MITFVAPRLARVRIYHYVRPIIKLLQMKQIKIKGKRVYKKTLVNNILNAFNNSTKANKEEGFGWYEMAYRHAEKMSQYNGLPTFQNVGIIAALSPLSSWERNKETALLYSQGQRKGLHTNKMIEKCAKIKETNSFDAVLEILNGDKIKSFAYNILKFGSFCPVTTIDRHAISVAYGRRISDKDRPTLTTKQYQFISDAYVDATKIIRKNTQVNILPQELQAITWVWFRIYGDTMHQ